MADMLLINPPLSWDEKFIKHASVQLPLGLLYIASMVKRAGYSVEMLDVPALRIGMDEVKKEIEKRKPKIVGVTAFTLNISRAMEIAKIAKEASGAKVIIGGYHVSAVPAETLEACKDFDVAVVGEGELTIGELMPALMDNKELGGIKGIAFRKKGETVFTGRRELIKDLDSLPYPDRELVAWEGYVRTLHRAMGGKSKVKFTSMVTSRGCPFGCVYCDKSVFGRTWRPRSAKSVVDEMEYVIKKYGVEEIIVFDDIFTLDRDRVIEICRLIKERGLKVMWTADARVHTVDLEMLEEMKGAGCYSIFFGVESGNQEVLDKMHKGITLAQVETAVKLAKKAGLTVTTSFMIGNPGETRQTVRDTINFAKKLNADIAEFYITTPFPGSELYGILEKENKIKVKNWDIYTPHTDKPVFEHENLTPEEMRQLYKQAYKEFYLRPKYILSQIKNMRGNSMLYVRGLLTFIKLNLGKIKY